MKSAIRLIVYCGVFFVGINGASADDTLKNRGNDPFFRISNALAECPVPLGPMITEQQWLGESHYRVERGNSCWVEGRCRLSNSYNYDAEIAVAVQRRLTSIAAITHWKDQTSLWLVLQRRFIYLQGCVSPDFDKKTFLFELAKTADVDQVVDQTMVGVTDTKIPYLIAPNARPPK
jgi:hypothetical protein